MDLNFWLIIFLFYFIHLFIFTNFHLQCEENISSKYDRISVWRHVLSLLTLLVPLNTKSPGKSSLSFYLLAAAVCNVIGVFKTASWPVIGWGIIVESFSRHHWQGNSNWLTSFEWEYYYLYVYLLFKPFWENIWSIFLFFFFLVLLFILPEDELDTVTKR